MGKCTMKQIKVGQKVFINGNEIGEIVDSPSKGRFMIKRYDSEWNIDFDFFCIMHHGEIEIRD